MRRTTCFIMGLFLVFSAAAVGSQTSTQAEIAELRRRLEALERRQQLEEQQRQTLERQLAEGEKERQELTKQLDEKTKTLAQEVEFAKLGQLLPEKAELKSEYGLGPAASAVYKVKRGLSIGAYGEVTYRKLVADKGSGNDQADFLRFVTYLGYKFNDHILFNSELELEHGTTDDIGSNSGTAAGSVSVEFAYLDFLWRKEANARIGMVLSPMGFINEIHEPPYFFGVRRPETAQVIIPTTWRPIGFGLFGDITDEISYRTYAINTFRASRFAASSALRGGRQKGNRALANDWGWVGRIDYFPKWLRGLNVGGSLFFGNSGQGQTFVNATTGSKSKPAVMTKLWEVHLEYLWRGLELRALGAWGTINNAGTLSLAQPPGTDPIPSRFHGYYVEAGYDVLPLIMPETTQYLAPFFRFERVNTQASVPDGFKADDSLKKFVYTVGFSYKPIPNVVLKLDYRNFVNDAAPNTADEFALGMGYAF